MNVSLTVGEIRELLDQTAHVAPLSRQRDLDRRSAFDKLKAALEHGDQHELLADSFEDERGRIEDLIEGPVDAVTRIFTAKGAVRGNHFHRQTVQWTYVLSGSLLVAHGDVQRILGPGEIAVDRPGVPHAWKALADTDVLVFTCGPRSGSGYESDTVRLEEPLIEPEPVSAWGDWGTLARIEHEAWVPTEDRAP